MNDTAAHPVRDVTVIGAGRMGLPIARRLARSGLRVHIVDTAAERRSLAAVFARTTSSEWDPDATTDAVLTVLPDAKAFESIAFGAAGITTRRGGSALWLDLTSNDPRVAERAASAWSRSAFVGAPMGGGPDDAARGTLSFWMSGDADSCAAALPLLSILAKSDGIHWAGNAVGDGYVVKLLSNALWFGQVTAVSEAIAVAARTGIPPERFTDLLRHSPARSAFIDDYLVRMLNGDYAADFGFSACVDELEIVRELSEAARLNTPSMVATLETHRRALERYGDIDGEMFAARVALDEL